MLKKDPNPIFENMQSQIPLIKFKSRSDNFNPLSECFGSFKKHMDFFDPESEEYLGVLGKFSQMYAKRDQIARNKDINPDQVINVEDLF